MINNFKDSDYISGEELGKYLIYNDIAMYNKQNNVKYENENIISQETMNELTGKLTNIEDAEAFECYVQLQMFVQRAQAMANAYNQQAQNGYCRLLMYMTQAQQVEHARRLIENLPVIMTQTQYKERGTPGPIARLRGVAIVAEEFPCRPKCLDINDYFIEPEIDCFQEMMSLETIESVKERIHNFRDNYMISGIKHQIAYNILFELIARRIDIPEFKVFCVEAQTLIDHIKQMNDQRTSFENEIAGEGNEYENKIRILTEVFEIIDTDAFYPSESVIESVREKLKDINIFRTSMNELILQLIENREK